MVQGALWNKAVSDYENINGTYYLRILKFDVSKKAFDPTFSAKYPLSSKVGTRQLPPFLQPYAAIAGDSWWDKTSTLMLGLCSTPD
jgi:hypothetical protein